MAKRCYDVAEKDLVAQREYQICIRYMPDPLTRFDRIRELRNLTLKLGEEDQLPLKEYAENSFVENTCRLIDILVGAGRIGDAEQVRERALAVRNTSALRTAVEAAVERQKSLQPVER